MSSTVHATKAQDSNQAVTTRGQAAANPPVTGSDSSAIIGSILGSVVGAKAVQGLNLPELIGALKGEEPAPPLLLGFAKLINQSSEVGADKHLLRGALDLLKGSGFDEDRVIGLAKMVGPMVGIAPVSDLESLHGALQTLSKRVVDYDEDMKIHGIVICPKCNFSHLV